MWNMQNKFSDIDKHQDDKNPLHDKRYETNKQ